MAGKNLLFMAALGVVTACAGDAISPDRTMGGGTPASNSEPTLGPTDAPPVPVTGNPIVGAAFWVNPASNAKITADAWRDTRPDDAAQMDKIASNSQARWFDASSGDILSAVDSVVSSVTGAGAVPVLVAYNIPHRDCGGLSAGGTTVGGYMAWIAAFANGLAGRKSVVILEPDALSDMNCLSAADQTTRVNLIQYAVQLLRAKGGLVYLDGGNSSWKSASDQAARLRRANVAAADGFFLNVSNFQYTSSSISYGKRIADLVGGKHFIIDTSRNGLGPTADNAWCNPAGRALGPVATTLTADPLVDAYLWIKGPGESDGSCGGAPTAGLWWADYALGLAQRSTI
jgi:endoglucanase